METNSFIIVPAHYAFILNDEDVKSYNETGPIHITKLFNDDFKVTGKEDDLQYFAESICMDDEESVNDIMDTLQDADYPGGTSGVNDAF